ncbi:MAG: glycoside hydrolase family protein [Lachnospiraceae bacterium]
MSIEKNEWLFEKVGKNQIFEREGWFIWGGSVCKEEDTYYLIVSAWEKKYGFTGWVCHSTVLLAAAEKPEGPFRFIREMEELKQQNWSNEVLHNPTIHRIGQTYYLFYVGTNGVTGKQNFDQNHLHEKYRYNQKIGVASGTTLLEKLIPYEHNPILEPSNESWDNTYVTNPSVLVKNNEIILVYKSLIKEELPEIVMKLGVAKSNSPLGPYQRIFDRPVIDENIEDPYLWEQNGTYYMLVKDMTGTLAGQPNETVLYQSKDGISWDQNCIRAFGTDICWEDGTRNYSNVERPQLYIEHGVPKCLYNAVGDLPERSFHLSRRLRYEE